MKRGRVKRKLLTIIILIILILFAIWFIFEDEIVSLLTGRDIQEQLPLRPLLPLSEHAFFDEISFDSIKLYTIGMIMDIDYTRSQYDLVITETSLPVEITFTNIRTNGFFKKNLIVYDDGLHDDGAAGDQHFGNQIPIDNSFVLGETYSQNSNVDRSPRCCFHIDDESDRIRILPAVQGECKEFVPGRNDPNDKTRLNIVVLGRVGSGSGSTFVPDWKQFFYLTNSHLNFDEGQSWYKDTSNAPAYLANQFQSWQYSFFNREPMKSYKGKFNLWYVDPMYSGDLPTTTSNNVANQLFFISYMRSRCQYQNTIYIIYDNRFFGREAAWTPLVIGTNNFGFSSSGVLSHELGHVIAGLGDEYEESARCSSSLQQPSTNSLGDQYDSNIYRASTSTNNKDSCSQNTEWNYIVGSCYKDGVFYSSCPISDSVSCYKGANYCYNAYFWRPQSNTFMLSTTTPTSVVDMSAFCKVFAKYIGVSLGVCNQLCINGCAKGEKCVGGVCTNSGVCPTGDSDSDGICNNIDNCPTNANAPQNNLDSDLLGDTCDCDADGDSYQVTKTGICTGTTQLDCNDLNALLSPGKSEICGNGIDENCNGNTDDICPVGCTDIDGDGYGTGTNRNSCIHPELDCEDTLINVNPGVVETGEAMCDNIDNDCDGVKDEVTRSCWNSYNVNFATGICRMGTEPCSQGIWTGACNGAVLPQVELCPSGTSCAVCTDSVDNNCDGVVDRCGCVISNPRWGKAIAQSGELVSMLFDFSLIICQASQRFDLFIYRTGSADSLASITVMPQLSGFTSWAPTPSTELDCNPATRICLSPKYYFVAKKQYDPTSNKTSGELKVSWECDTDADLYLKQSCIPSSGPQGVWDTSVSDCDDNNPSINPVSVEIPYDGKDNDCKASTKDDDIDGDTYNKNLDCNDNNPLIHPNAAETCNNLDENCNGMSDEPYNTYYLDSDSDAYGNTSVSAKACSVPVGYVANSNDCLDNNANVKPGVLELCTDTIDNNCNGAINENCGCVEGSIRTCGSNIGECRLGTQTCSSGVWGSCIGGQGSVSEVCDGKDNDCDSKIDNGVLKLYYRDMDADSFGDKADPAPSPAPCGSVPSGSSISNTDCDDNEYEIKPTAIETCNEYDDNCNGITDEGFTKPIFYLDLDKDGYGKSSSSLQACSLPYSYSVTGNDCNDNNANIKPGVSELCDNIDSNCNGFDDEPYQVAYPDLDGDGLGSSESSPILSCLPKDKYAANGLDCKDDDASLGRPVTCKYNGNSCGSFSLCVKDSLSCPSPPIENCNLPGDEDCTLGNEICPAKAPSLNVISPLSNDYINVVVPLKFSANEATSCWIILDSVRRDTSCVVEDYLSLAQGSHTLSIFANNLVGQDSRNIEFNVTSNRRIIVLYDKFVQNQETTNLLALTDKELENVSLILDAPSIGRIEFFEGVNLSADANKFTNITNLDSGINISFNRIEVDKSLLPILSQSKARIQFEGLSFAKPRVLKDLSVCADCLVESYSNGKLIVVVNGFSTYTIEETAQVEQPPVNTGGSSSGSSSGSGGSSIISKPRAEPANNNSFITEDNIQKISLQEDKIDIIEVGLIKSIILDLYDNQYEIKFEIVNNDILLKTSSGDYLIPKEEILTILLGDKEVYVAVKRADANGAGIILGLNRELVKEQLESSTIENKTKVQYLIIGIILLAIVVVLIVLYLLKRKNNMNNFYPINEKFN